MKQQEIQRLTKTQFTKKLISLFVDETGCSIQYGNCPCNRCFHCIDETIDFQHIVWLILLGLRGDYQGDEIIDSIREELKNGK